MTSLRQIEANRRNARLSTGPVTEEGKRRSRQNALRHGLTAETVIDALEDANDYAAFEMAVTADYDVQSAVERELVLRLASLLWRLRRATAVESGLFKIEAKQLLQFQKGCESRCAHQEIINGMNQGNSLSCDANDALLDDGLRSTARNKAELFDNLTRSFVQLTDLPTYPLDRLSRYEGTLWRQARQTLLALQAFHRKRSRRENRFRDGTPW
jgi:hypothetical protein